MKRYTVVVNGKPTGPFSLEELRGMKISSGTFVRTEGMDDYKEAHELAELRELFNIKAEIRKPQYFASLDIRLLAVLIDYFLVFAAYCLLMTVVILFVEEQEERIIVAISGLAIIPVAKLIYSIFAESSVRQGTYGKVLLGIKVTDEEGKPINGSRAFARNISKLVCIATLGLGYVYGFFDRRQQGLHDKMAGTMVIKDRLV